VIAHAPGARFFQAGSSEVFGQAMQSPQNERTEFRPRSPYGQAKAQAHAAVVAARADHKLFAVSGILFNHESPRRGRQFVTRKISMGVARIRQGLQSELVLGDLDGTRDWGFAGDYVDAMWRMLQQPQPTDYVIGTGKSWTVRELCDMAFRCAGLDYREHVRVDEALVRPREAVPLVADARLARRELDWHPRTAFPEVVKMMVEADISRVGVAA
jgi:GDPmannose 4,6-dehydratase